MFAVVEQQNNKNHVAPAPVVVAPPSVVVENNIMPNNNHVAEAVSQVEVPMEAQDEEVNGDDDKIEEQAEVRKHNSVIFHLSATQRTKMSFDQTSLSARYLKNSLNIGIISNDSLIT